MDWNAVCDALETAANTVDGINAFSEVPDNLPTIAFVVGEIDIDLNVAMRRRRATNGPRLATDQAVITCRILVARYDDKAAMRKLRLFMSGSGPTSIVDAIEEDRTLGGTVDDSVLRELRGNRLFQVGDTRYYGIELDLFVIGDA